MDFDLTTDLRVNIEERESKVRYFDLPKTLKTREHEEVVDTKLMCLQHSTRA